MTHLEQKEYINIVAKEIKHDTQYDHYFERDPDVINEKGTRFWKSTGLTDYAVGLGLTDVLVWYIVTSNDERKFIIAALGKLLATGKTLDEIRERIDTLSKN